MNFKQLNFSQKIFSLVTIVFTITNGINAAAQAHAHSSSSASSGSFGGWLKSWFVSAPTEQQKKIATIVGERATERQKKLADVLYDATLLPEDLIKIIIVYDERVFSQHTESITALVVLSHGRLASASKDKTVKIWNVEQDRCMHTLEHQEEVTALATIGTELIGAASGSKKPLIKIWNINSEQCQLTLEDTPIIPLQEMPRVGPFPKILALITLPNQNLVSMTSGLPWHKGKITIWDTSTGKEIRSIAQDDCCTALSILSDGTLVLAIEKDEYNTDSGTICSHNILFFDSSTGNQQQTDILWAHAAGIGYGISALATLQNNQLVSAGHDGDIKIWDLQTMKETKKYSSYYSSLIGLFHSGAIFLAPLSNNQLASGWHDKKIRIIDLNTMQCVRTLEGHTGAVTALTALPSGQLASGSEDGTVRIWNLEQEEHKE